MAKLRSLLDNDFFPHSNKLTQSSTSNYQEVLEISVEDIDIDVKGNIRDTYNAAALQELAQSIQKHGLLEPVGVFKNRTGKYKLIYGFRRALAITKFTNLKTIRAITVTKESDLSIVQLLENIQREDLTDYEIAKTLSKLKKSMNCNLETLAQEIDKSLSWVKKKMAHGNFLEKMESEMEDNDPEQLRTLRSLTSDQATSLSKLSSKDKKSALNLVKEGKATVKNLREFSKQKKSSSSEHFAVNPTSKALGAGSKSKPMTKAQLNRVSKIKSQIAKLSADKIKIEKQIQKLELELVGIQK
jgi:ParB family chromosome partitioning protein